MRVSLCVCTRMASSPDLAYVRRSVVVARARGHSRFLVSCIVSCLLRVCLALLSVYVCLRSYVISVTPTT